MGLFKKLFFNFFNIIYLVLRKSHKVCQRELTLKAYDIHSSVGFWETTTITGTGTISIGKGTYIGKNSFISSQGECHIKIGQNCKISHNVHIRTLSYDASSLTLDVPGEINSNIEIGDNVWIGLNVYIKGGVSIGSGSTIGANSVVVNSVPEKVIAAGVPAKVIKILEA
jgi:acetyltransferase-like isoleucine patch superfamily enzyme